MTLPGDRIPDEALPAGGHPVPAGDAELAPVWCRHSVRWSYVPDKGGYLCDDPDHNADETAATTACAVEDGTVFANPPNEAQRAALRREETLGG
jgi:hypothetical protein